MFGVESKIPLLRGTYCCINHGESSYTPPPCLVSFPGGGNIPAETQRTGGRNLVLEWHRPLASVPGEAGTRHLKVSRDPSWHRSVGEWFRAPGVESMPQPDPSPRVESSWSSSCSFPLHHQEGILKQVCGLADLPPYNARKEKENWERDDDTMLGKCVSSWALIWNLLFHTLMKDNQFNSSPNKHASTEQFGKSAVKYNASHLCQKTLLWIMHSSYPDNFRVSQK